MAARLLLALVLPLVSVSLAPGGVLLRRARLTDSWGMAKVCCDSFYPENAKINGVDARIPWAAALLRRLVAIKRGSLSPHGVFVAVEGDVVVGCVEIGLLPAPPGCVVAPEATAEASEAAALWRGVAVENRAAWRPPGQQKGAKIATSKAPISVVFHSFWLMFRRVIIPRNGLEA